MCAAGKEVVKVVVRSVVRRSRLRELGVGEAAFSAAGETVPVGATVEIPRNKKIVANVTIENTGSADASYYFIVYVYYADTLSDSSGAPDVDDVGWSYEAEATDFASSETKITLKPGDTLTLTTSGVPASTWDENTTIDAGIVLGASATSATDIHKYLDSLKIADAVKIIAPTLRVEITDVTFSEA